MTQPYLQTYSSNPADDAIIAKEVLQLAAIHASLSQAQSLRELPESCLRGGNDGKAARLRNQIFPQNRADFAVRGTISGETVAARSPQSLYFRGGNTVTPDQRETDPQCAASRVQGSAGMLH